MSAPRLINARRLSYTDAAVIRAKHAGGRGDSVTRLMYSFDVSELAIRHVLDGTTHPPVPASRDYGTPACVVCGAPARRVAGRSAR